MTKPYTVAGLAERWGCSDSHIYALIRGGRLAFFTLGGPLGHSNPNVTRKVYARGSVETLRPGAAVIDMKLARRK